jgi:hypothetical protein
LILDEIEMEVNWSIIRSLPRGKMGNKFRVDFDIDNSHTRPISMSEILRKGKAIFKDFTNLKVSKFVFGVINFVRSLLCRSVH